MKPVWRSSSQTSRTLQVSLHTSGLYGSDLMLSLFLVVGTSCGILVVLFLLQPFGITRLASSFAPIVIIWLLFNLVFGIYVS